VRRTDWPVAKALIWQQFRDREVPARRLRRGLAQAAVTPGSLPYRALINSLGASPENFQLIYPLTTWIWPTQNGGCNSAARFDFCSTVPRWSAAGAFASCADRLNEAYGAFLDVILAATDDPKLREETRVSGEAPTAAANDYTLAVSQASTTQADQVTENDPTVTDWLASPAGRGYAIKIEAANTRLTQAQINYKVAVAKANAPDLADAHEQFGHQDSYSRLSDSGLSKFPLVPYWYISTFRPYNQRRAVPIPPTTIGSAPSM
jgi:hypothetical protein